MSTRSTETHENRFLSLRKGKFYFYSAGTPVTWTTKYDGETPMFDHAVVVTQVKKLARLIAGAIIETGVTYMLHNSACDFPEDEGRPGFDRFVLNDMISDILENNAAK